MPYYPMIPLSWYSAMHSTLFAPCTPRVAERLLEQLRPGTVPSLDFVLSTLIFAAVTSLL
jgi:hypothetical protein